MYTRIVITEFHLRAGLRRFVVDPAGLAVCTVGLSMMDDCTEWLVRRVEFPTRIEASRPTVILTAQPLLAQLDPIWLDNRPAAIVYLPREGRAAIRVYSPGGGWEAGSLRVIGPGLMESGLPGIRFLPNPAAGEDARWSRVSGALGDSAWRRFRSLHCAVVGCGRTGSLTAFSLARMGVRRITLIDPDCVEPHNLDGEGFLPKHLGRPKAEVLAEGLKALSADLLVLPCTASVTALGTLQVLKEADVLICCADNDGARFACGLLSALYLKPMLDIGVAVLQDTLGADIRWIVPGEACLTCFGGVANIEHVSATFRSRADEEQFRSQRVWRHERAGSLCSLNMTAAGLGLQMMVNYLSGTLSGRAWLQLEYREGVPHLQTVPAPSCTGTEMCRFLGWGDEGLLEAAQLGRQDFSHFGLEIPNR
jgi:hypothetical protein